MQCTISFHVKSFLSVGMQEFDKYGSTSAGTGTSFRFEISFSIGRSTEAYGDFLGPFIRGEDLRVPSVGVVEHQAVEISHVPLSQRWIKHQLKPKGPSEQIKKKHPGNQQSSVN
jgi:hypothetical protein